MRILITGGAGFIGSNFVKYMANKYPRYRLVIIDSLTYAGNTNNISLHETGNYRFIKGDITDSDFIEEVFQAGVHVVVNFAAESHVDRSIKDPGIFVRTNIQGTQVLLDAARRYEINKFIQISTDEVYGDLGKIGLFTEETPLAPNSPYSASKAGADLLVRAYNQTYNLPVNITRCSNNYGPFQHPEKLVPHMIINAIHERALPLYGDGRNIRDWLHVEDHCRAIDLVLHHGKTGEVYNIGGNNELENLSVVKIILSHLNKSEKLIQFVGDRLGHDKRYAIDASKITNELGWKPKYSFKEGIEQTIRWYMINRHWWD